MKILRAASGGLMGMLCLLILQSCGGSSYGGGGGSSSNPTPITISVQPTTVVAGQSATVTWSVTTGSSCTASGAWSGPEPLSGTQTVSPTAAGTDMYTLTCSGGAYSSNSKTATLTVTAASAFSVTNLVADNAAGNAMNVDANLVNPWGLSIPTGTDPAWIANNGTQTSTLYDGDGKSQHAPADGYVIKARQAFGNKLQQEFPGAEENRETGDAAKHEE